MTTDKPYADLVKWPTTEAEVSVDLMLRILGEATQREYLEKMALLKQGKHKGDGMPLYLAKAEAVMSSVGLMAAMRALKEADPQKAEAFARNYWLACESGDSWGEMLWEFTQEAGLDPSLIQIG